MYEIRYVGAPYGSNENGHVVLGPFDGVVAALLALRRRPLVEKYDLRVTRDGGERLTHDDECDLYAAGLL